MQFTSWAFLLFLAVLVPVYFLVPKRMQWIVLLLANAVFVCFAGLFDAVCLLLAIAAAYGTARRLSGSFSRQRETLAAMKETHTKEERKAARLRFEKRRRLLLIAYFVFSLVQLFVFRYMAEASMEILRRPTGLRIAVTLGAAYYMLSTFAYVLDVSRETVPAEKNPFRFALYVSFFPLLIQGPITRFDTVGQQLFTPHKFDGRRFLSAALRITWGYWKMLLITGRLNAAVAALTADPARFTGAYILLEMALHAIRLYAGFTGSIDIAIGVGELFGVTVEENFFRPFFSKSISEYWRRWHITLGDWFKRYVYYPLSVSKPMRALSKSTRKLGAGVSRRVPVYLATILVWALTGLWHGFRLTFLVWGLLNGIVILLSEELKPLYARFRAKFPKLTESTFYRGFTVIRTVFLLSSLRILDCYDTVKDAFSAFFSIFTKWNIGEVLGGGYRVTGLSPFDRIVVGVGVLLMFTLSMIQRKGPIRKRLMNRGIVLSVCVLLLLIGTILVFGRYGFGFDASQFIYNQRY